MLFYSFYSPCIKRMAKPIIGKRKRKFNKLHDDLSIKLIKGTKSSIFYMKEYITNGDNLKKIQLI